MAKLLSTGSVGEDVKKLQQALLEKGYDLGSAGADGIFGAKTEAAVRAYQKSQNLTVDGLAGEKTQAALYAAPAQATAPAEEKNDVPVYTPSYEGLLSQLEQEIQARPDYTYDLEQDPLYRQYRQAYMTQGRRAAEDVQARAAALTGGYGSSYGQAVAGQTYDSYLARLADLAPTLEQTAYDRYRQEGEDLLSRYQSVQKQAQAQWEQYQDQLAQYRAEKKEAYSRLQSLVKAGYQPTDQELQAAGMTAAQAAALAPKAKTSGSGSSGSGYDNQGYSELEIIRLQKFLGVEADGKFGQQSKAAMKEKGYSSLKKAMTAMENSLGYFAYDDAVHSHINRENNGQSMYQAVRGVLTGMLENGASLTKAGDYLKQMVGGSYITQSEYLKLYNDYRNKNL